MARIRNPIGNRVLRMLLFSNLDTLRAADVARRLHISPSTLRRRLRSEQTSYQKLLDRARRYRCKKALSRRWLPGKTIAGDLGFSQPNSFYRAFGRWTGMSYSEYKRQLRVSSVERAQRLY